MANIKDIARLSGYSIGTVSRVINHKPDVNEETRKKIEEIIARENFQPNYNAKVLKQSIVSPVEIYIKGTNNIFLESLLEKVQELMQARDEDVNVVFLDEAADEVSAAVQSESEKHPKGFIFLGGSMDHFAKHYTLEAPAVLITGDAGDLSLSGLSSYSTDDYKGSYEAAKLLMENGHEKIGILGGHMSVEKGIIRSARLKGAADAMEAHGISFDPDRQFVACRFSMKEGYEAMQRLLKKMPDLTAVFAHSDILAIGAARALHDAGKEIPQDVSLIGFDGIEYNDYYIPRIATVRQNLDAMAEKGVEDLLYRMHYKKDTSHEKIPFVIEPKESIRRIR